MKIIFLIIVFILLLSQSAFSKVEKPGKISINYISNYNSSARESEFTVILKINIEKGWHIYWKNPGDAGLPTTFDWNLPEGIEKIDEIWEIPEVIPFDEYANIGYKNQVGFILKFKSSKPMSDTLKLKCIISWLICKEGCYPGKDSLNIVLPLKDKKNKKRSWDHELSKILNKIPVLNADFKINASLNDKVVKIEFNNSSIDFNDIKSAIFISEESGKIQPFNQSLKINDNSLLITVLLDIYRENDPDKLTGLLIITKANNTKIAFKLSFNII